VYKTEYLSEFEAIFKMDLACEFRALNEGQLSHDTDPLQIVLPDDIHATYSSLLRKDLAELLGKMRMSIMRL
jgi:hypothetical protein